MPEKKSTGVNRRIVTVGPYTLFLLRGTATVDCLFRALEKFNNLYSRAGWHQYHTYRSEGQSTYLDLMRDVVEYLKIIAWHFCFF